MNNFKSGAKTVLVVFMLMFFALDSSLQAACLENPLLIAAPKKSINSGADFMLSRKVIVKADNTTVYNELKKRLQSHGVLLDESFHRKVLGPVIVAKRCDKIDNMGRDNDALRIEVRKSKIVIRYTSDLSFFRALEIVESNIISRRGVRVVNGGQYWDWDGALMGGGLRKIDIATRYMSDAELETLIRRLSNVSRAKRDQMMLCVVDRKSWRLGVNTFDIVNPNQSIFPDGGNYYSLSSLNKVLGKANKERINLVPLIDIAQGNESFERVTGHAPNSVEGMRFVRHMIEQYAGEVKCRKISLGDLGHDSVDQRFREFVENMVEQNGLELVNYR